MVWKKSSFSGQNAQCVEVSWRKSSASGYNNDCVEVRNDLGAVRDSKNEDGPTLININVREFARWAAAAANV